ncbi:S-adenosyl-L-methionine-dependent methyltransferase [Serendipita vermifera]|nr:S-adenosyl-L-methionine-dependent methyltransferase [Serendipita vermifera]
MESTSNETSSSLLPLDPNEIAKLSLHDPSHFYIQLQSTEMRIELVHRWGIKPGSRILEVGCGQGDCTAVLATVVGPKGHVVAVDPGAPDYGSPYTLARAQSHLSEGPLGSRITFIHTDPIRHLSTLREKKGADESVDQFSYDYAVFALCLWYFSTPSEIKEALAVVSRHARVVCLAEWSMAPSRAFPGESYPHVLAACAQAALAAYLLRNGGQSKFIMPRRTLYPS